MIHSYADGRIEDTGPLNTARMPTVDEEFLGAAKNFINRANQDKKPFFVWFNTTRMHVFTHLKKESLGKTGKGIHADGMVEHDGHVGELLKQLDDLGITNDTIVLYTTDNGAELALWPDGAMTMFHGEKGTTWEGGFRNPMMIRWPGVIKPGTVYNDIISLMDWFPTFAAAAGEPNIGKAGLDMGHEYADGMWEMDQNVGKLLKTLDDSGISNDTIVVFTTDNGPNFFSWPDAANTPFRSEKDSNWEGAFRVPAMVRWPGRIKPGQVTNALFSGLDWFPTLVAAAGDNSIKDRLFKGTSLGGKSVKVHLDGYNQCVAHGVRADSSIAFCSSRDMSLSIFTARSWFTSDCSLVRNSGRLSANSRTWVTGQRM